MAGVLLSPDILNDCLDRVDLWSAGVPDGALRSFVERFVAPLYGQFIAPVGRHQIRLASWQTCLLFYGIGYGLWATQVDQQRGSAGLLVLAYVMRVKSVWMLMRRSTCGS